MASNFRITVILILMITMVFFSCTSSEDEPALPATVEDEDTAFDYELPEPKKDIESILNTQFFSIVQKVVSTDTNTKQKHTGYLAEDVNSKKCLVLQGSHYNMGYQMGYLMAEGTYKMTKIYPYRILREMLGLDKDESLILSILEKAARTLCQEALEAIPDDLELEMEGIAEGATARLAEKDMRNSEFSGGRITFEDLLLLNEGFDALFAMLYTGMIPNIWELEAALKLQYPISPGLEDAIKIVGSKVVFPKAKPYLLGCNGFVVSGNATLDGKVYHGRDFMFPTGEIYNEYACMAVYLPEKGLPFSAVTGPGFVGLITGLNSEGLSMGVDVVYGSCTRDTPGLGCLLTIRDIVQNSSNLETAVSRMKAQDRGVAWLYVMADDETSSAYTHGLVAETGMSTPGFTGPDLLPIFQQLAFGGAISRLDSDVPDRGVSIRNQAWVYPEAFRDLPFSDGEMFGLHFPDQIEIWPDVVLATNHYIIPRMVFTTFSPWISLIESSYWKNSMPEERYQILVGLLEKEYGHIDFEVLRELTDFLNPNRGNMAYHYEVGGSIEGHHAIIDNQALIVEALYGYYGDWENDITSPWARIELKPFLE